MKNTNRRAPADGHLPQGPIVVGVDSSPESWTALAWAIEEATRRHTSLHIVGATSEGADQATRSARLVCLANAVARARSLAPDLKIAIEMPEAGAANALVAASRSAACVVVGTRGRRPVVGAILGTTSAEVARRASCPVVVVRRVGEVEPGRPGVIVGTDGTGDSSRAIGFAFAHAADRGLPLTVVHACTAHPHGDYVPPWQASDPAARTAKEQAATAKEIAGWSAKYPDVPVRRHVLRADPVSALVDHSRGAELLVVGSRGFGGLSGMVIGSVSQRVLASAHCPVAVVTSRSHS